MAIRITQNFNQDALNSFVERQTARVEAAILFRLKFVGEAFIVNARNNNTYHDVTGNLRSSIGYVIAKDGDIIETDFKESNAGSDKATGVSQAQQLARDILEQNRSGYVLICVAGMNYAATVESRGFDVISNASINAEQDLTKAIQSLNDKLKRK